MIWTGAYPRCFIVSFTTAAPSLALVPTAQLKRMALNASKLAGTAASGGSSKKQQSKGGKQQQQQQAGPRYLVSFAVEPISSGSISISSAPQLAAEGVAPRLKVKKLQDGTLEVALRQVRASMTDVVISVCNAKHPHRHTPARRECL